MKQIFADLFWVILIAVDLVWCAINVVLTLIVAQFRPATWVDEDSGSSRDANAHHVCWHCGTHIQGPVTGLRIPDSECLACYLSRRSPGETQIRAHRDQAAADGSGY